MNAAFRAIALAIVKGFLRDKMSMFFAVVFPLMFLVLFGGVFNYGSSPRIDLVEVGHVALVDGLSPGAKHAFDKTFEVIHVDGLGAAVASGSARATPTRRSRCAAAPWSRTTRRPTR